MNYWICPECGEKVRSPEIPQVGMNRRYGGGVVTQADVDDAYAEFDEKIANHICRFDCDDSQSKLTERIMFRTTPEHRAYLQAAASAAGMKLGQYVRYRLS